MRVEDLPIDEPDDELLKRERRILATKVRALCGDISPVTLLRWLKELGFPQPIRIKGQRYWRAADVVAWLERQGKDTT